MAQRRGRSRSIWGVLGGAAPPATTFALYVPLVAMAALLLVALFGGFAAFDADRARETLALVAAIHLSFLAGARYGRSLTASARSRLFAPVPPVVGWAALLLPTVAALPVLALAHAAQGAWDVWSADGIRLPAWYAALRSRTTIVTVLLLVAAFPFGG